VDHMTNLKCPTTTTYIFRAKETDFQSHYIYILILDIHIDLT